MDLTKQSHLESPARGTKRKGSVVPLGSPPLRPNPPWNPKQDALSHLFESEVADDHFIPLSRGAAKYEVIQDAKRSEVLRSKQIPNPKAENAQDRLFDRFKTLSETLQRTQGIEHLPLDKSESISKILDCLIPWCDHANTAREKSSRTALEVQGEFQNRYDSLLAKDLEQKEKIASLTRELEANRTGVDVQGDLQNRYDSLLAKSSEQKEKIASLKDTCKESNRKASEAQRDSRIRYNSLIEKYNSLAGKNSEQKDTITSLKGRLGKMDQSKHSREECERKTSETQRELQKVSDAQRELQSRYDSLLAKDSEQKGKIAALTRDIKIINLSKRNCKESYWKALEEQKELQNQYDSLLAKDSEQKGEIASLTKELEEANLSKDACKESNGKVLEAQRELQDRYDLLLAKELEQKKEIESLTGDLKKVDQSKRTYKESYRTALNAQKELRNQYGVLLTGYSKQEGTITSLNKKLKEANESKDTCAKEAHDLREERDDKAAKIALLGWERKKASIELDELRKAHESESASLRADRDRYFVEAKRMQKAEADLKLCGIDLKQAKDELASLQAKPDYHKDYQEEMCKSEKLQKERDEIEARLEKSEEDNQLNLHMWKKTWEATSCENENTKKALYEEYKTSGDLLVKVAILEQQLDHRQQDFDGQGKEWCHEKEVFEVQIANLEKAVERSNDLQGEVEELRKQLDDRQKELDGQGKEWYHEREASKVEIRKLKVSYSNAKIRLKTMNEEREAEIQKHNATVEDLKANSRSEIDMLLSSCKTTAATHAEELNRQLKEEKEKVSKLVGKNHDFTRRAEFYQRALGKSQQSLEEAGKTINQLCLVAVICRKKNKDSLAKREVILSKAVERAKVLEVKLTALQDELNASQLDLTEMQSMLERKKTEADAESKLLKETASRLAQLHHLHSACLQNRRFQLGYLNRQTLLADFSEFTATLADGRRFMGEQSGREVEVCLGFLQGQPEAVCLIQGVEDQRCLQILQLARGDCCIITHSWRMWIRLGRDKPLYILVSKVDDMSWMERSLPKGLCSSEDLSAIG